MVKCIRVGLVAILAFLAVSRPARAQEGVATGEQEASSGQQQGDVAGGSGSPQNGIDQASATSAPVAAGDSSNSTAFPVTKLGSAQWLEPNLHSQIHLGPIYVGSVSVSALGASGLDEAGQTLPGMSYLAVVNTDVNFDWLTHGARITIQYLPDVVILDGVVQTNLDNQGLALNISHRLSSRWTVTFQNVSSYVKGNAVYGASNFDVSPVTGNGVESPLLQNPQEWFNNSTGVSVSYQLNARDQLNFGAGFQYSHSDLSFLPEDAYTYTASVGWGHQLDATKSIGFQVQATERDFSSLYPQLSSGQIGATFSDRLSPTLIFNAALGSGTEFSAGTWYEVAVGDAIVRKDFKTSSIAMEVFRGINGGPFLTNGYSTRVDSSYSRALGSRCRASLGAGFESDTYDNTQFSFSGTVVTGFLGCGLTRRLSWFASYAERWENLGPFSAGTSSAPGIFVSSGLSWSFTRAAGPASPVPAGVL